MGLIGDMINLFNRYFFTQHRVVIGTVLDVRGPEQMK